MLSWYESPENAGKREAQQMGRERTAEKSVTLSDVARTAGVAPMTVSRYLNQHPNISEKTARKVAFAIKKLDYRPNMAARILMGQPSNTMGLIVPNLADSFFSEIAHSVQATARERGKLVWVASSNSDPEVEASLLYQMKQHHVDGVMLIPASAASKEAVLAQDLPTVVLDRPLAECNAVMVDNRGGAAKMVQHLVEHGYHRILCVSVDDRSIYTIGERIAGYEDVMRSSRLRPASYTGLQTQVRIAEQVMAALGSSSPPEAIFCTNNITTLHVLETLYEAGLEFPSDVAIGGFDDFDLAALIRPGVTVIRQPAAELGAQAARCLLELAAQGRDGVRGVTTTLPTTLIVRGSCGCNPAKNGKSGVRA
jgi:LacI family transcriptional regulator